MRECSVVARSLRVLCSSLAHGLLVLPLVSLALLVGVTPRANAQNEPRNFDARVEYNQDFVSPTNLSQSRAVDTLRARIPGLAITYDPHTGVSLSLNNRTGYLTGRDTGTDALDIVLRFARANYALLGLSATDLAEYDVADSIHSKATGATHIYLRQRYRGLPVYNGQLQITVNRRGRILSVNNTCMPQVADAAKAMTPAIDAVQAVVSAADHLGLGFSAAPRLLSKGQGPQQITRLDYPNISREEIRAQLMLLPIRRGDARLVWNFQIYTLDERHVYDFTVDAVSAKVWTRFDWVSSDQYRVYPLPSESPNHSTPLPPVDGRKLVVDPADSSASPLGWHNTGSSSFTIMRGNNVHAYQDQEDNNQPPGSQPSCGSSLSCDFPISLDQPPSSYTAAAVANLFYWNNVIHDIQYRYGFDEPAGNFQVNNFANGGAGGDNVRAEAQDGSGTNNANFFTPPDGSRPRMQMFLWNLANPDRDGDLDNGIVIHEYGHGISIRQVGGPSNSSCLNNNQQPGEGWSDWFALVYTAEAGDKGTDRRGIGTYALGEPTDGDGIRTQPYSTDPASNNHTYESIRGMAIPHGVGEVWGQALWEVYWALVNRYGFNPDLYDVSAGAGNHRALLYVNEGLKNTSCSPSFTQARDGIIQAAVDNFGGTDVCLLWKTFADFGLGVDAVSGGANSTNPTNGFQVPASCQCEPLPVVDAGPDENICPGDTAAIGTSALPGHIYNWSPGGQTTAQISVSPPTTTTYTLTATTACGAAQDDMTVFVGDGTGGLDENFEGGTTGWAATGLWHLANDSQCATPNPGYSSPLNAFYYGQEGACNYDTGGANSGELTSPLVHGITSESTLSFDYFRVIENFAGGSFDRTEVDIVTDNDSMTVFTLDSTDASNAAWTNSGPISVAAFAGQSIRVRFRFDSVDAVANGFPGWFIDDVVVTGTSACGPGNTPPAVTITSPADGTTVVEGRVISFAGSATDAEDGDLSSSLGWESNLDGVIGAGRLFSAALSVGTHTITASVTDSGNLDGFDAVSVNVQANTVPSVTINSPTDGATFTQDTSITFIGTATDAEDGDLTAVLRWLSSLDGEIGAGGSFSTSALSVGTHAISASVTDSGELAGSSAVSISVIEPGGPADTIDWTTSATTSYSNQDRAGSISIEDGGATFFMQGNRWRRTVETFTVTPFTVIEFEFQSTSQGEIHGIGFDEDDTLNNGLRIFQLFGTQTWGGAIQAYNGQYTVGNFTTYRIPVGAFYTGSALRLVLVNDKDVGTLNNTSRFRNVRVFESAPNVSPLDFNLVTTGPYSNQDLSGTIAVEDGGLTFFMEGNRWRRSDQSFTIAPETMIAFEFMSTSQGEIHGLGFDEDNTLSNGPRLFKIFGTQNWSGDIDWFQPYGSGDIGAFKTFVIPVGRFYTGSDFRLMLVNDKDAAPGNNSSRFRNVRIYTLE